MSRVSTNQTERVGVEAVRLAFAELGWFPKEAERPDYGVDLFVETSDEDGRPSGRLLGVQVKSGSSYFAANGDGVLYVDEAHIEYWLRYSLPVVVAVYDPQTRSASWEVISRETVEQTGQRWKVTAPRAQALDAGARVQLAELAASGPDPDRAASALSQLRADLTWMQVLEQEGSVVVEADEWINKTSGRGDFRLVAKPADGAEVIEGNFIVFLGRQPYAQALRELFPWADLYVDERAIDEHDEDEWMQETGIWDSEDKRYIGNAEDFNEWRASRYPSGKLRPYAESAGEVAHWRVLLQLNELGRATLALERYLARS
jgi:hypothetical protein